MSFGCKSSLEWCTLLPSPDHPRKSPVFVLQGNEWFFCFLYEKSGSSWYFEVYLELHSKRREIKETSVKFQIGFKKEETLSLKTGECKISEHREVWYMSVGELQAKLPSDYLDGNWIKFIFNFVDVADPFIEIINKSDKAVQTPLYIDTRFQLEAVTKDFSSLFDAGPNRDVEFLCGDETIKAHRDVICCRSTVFASMFETDMQEGQTGQIRIDDMESSILQQFLQYLYTGVLPDLSFDTILCMYQAADKYAVDTLKKQCACFLTDNLSHENVFEVIVLSDRHNDADLKKDVIECMLKEKIPLRIGKKWSDFCKENPTLANEVLNTYYMNSAGDHKSEKQ